MKKVLRMVGKLQRRQKMQLTIIDETIDALEGLAARVRVLEMPLFQAGERERFNLVMANLQKEKADPKISEFDVLSSFDAGKRKHEAEKKASETEAETEAESYRDIALTCYQLLSNAAGFEVEDGEMAVSIIANTLRNMGKKQFAKLRSDIIENGMSVSVGTKLYGKPEPLQYRWLFNETKSERFQVLLDNEWLDSQSIDFDFV